MDLFTEEDWMEFAELVNSLGILFRPEEEVVFRGSPSAINRDYVLAPANDADTVAKLLENEPSLFLDAGMKTVLSVSKSVEMHLRLIYLGTDKEKFGDSDFNASAALNSIAKWIDGKGPDTPILKVKKGEKNYREIQAGGEYFLRFILNYQRMRKEVWRFIKISRELYGCGHQYRHNEIRDWSTIKPIYEKQVVLFNEFCDLFDKLTRVNT